MIILSISGSISDSEHNSSATLIINGEVKTSVEEERICRKKYFGKFPIHAINHCLYSNNIKISDVDVFVFVGNQKLLRKNIEKLDPWFYLNGVKFDESLCKDLFLKVITRLCGKLKPSAKVMTVNHQIAHAASAYYTSPFEKSAVLIVEGMGDDCSAALFDGVDGNIKLKHIFLRAPYSLGRIYRIVSQHLGFDSLGGPGKVMGLAGFGKPDKKYFNEIIQCSEDPRTPIKLPMIHRDFFTFWKNGIFGRERKFDEPLTQRHYDIAASLQSAIEQALMQIVWASHKLLPERKCLCTAGGVMLNVNSNTEILKSGLFEDYHFTPAANDGGLSLGAGLYIAQKNADRKRSKFSVYLGPDISKDFDIQSSLKFYGPYISYKKLNNVVEDAASLLSEGGIIGWAQGKMEWGPRALGNRSILANPLITDVKQQLDSKVKVREKFRPYAASVLAEEIQHWFGAPYNLHMLCASEVLPTVKYKIPGIVHVDGTCRPQCVKKDDNQRYHALITQFFKETACPILLNTSFNLHGEPIVNSPEDMIDDLLLSGLDAIYINDYKVTANRNLLPRKMPELRLPYKRSVRNVFFSQLHDIINSFKVNGFCIFDVRENIVPLFRHASEIAHDSLTVWRGCSIENDKLNFATYKEKNNSTRENYLVKECDFVEFMNYMFSKWHKLDSIANYFNVPKSQLHYFLNAFWSCSSIANMERKLSAIYNYRDIFIFPIDTARDYNFILWSILSKEEYKILEDMVVRKKFGKIVARCAPFDIKELYKLEEMYVEKTALLVDEKNLLAVAGCVRCLDISIPVFYFNESMDFFKVEKSTKCVL